MTILNFSVLTLCQILTPTEKPKNQKNRTNNDLITKALKRLFFNLKKKVNAKLYESKLILNTVF